jgi:hypothetical protein
MAGAIEETTDKLLLCCSKSDETFAQNLISSLQKKDMHDVTIVCPGVTEEWGETAHDSANEGLKDFSAAVVIASKALFSQSENDAAAKRILDALFVKSGKILILRSDMTEEELKAYTTMGYAKSLDVKLGVERVAEKIYAKITNVKGVENCVRPQENIICLTGAVVLEIGAHIVLFV